jgi:hypothetical protein
MRMILASLYCFRFIAAPSTLITLFVSWILFQSGSPLFLVYALWTKLITTGILLLFVILFRSSQFYFFNNLGYTNFSILVRMSLFDLLIATMFFTIALVI